MSFIDQLGQQRKEDGSMGIYHSVTGPVEPIKLLETLKNIGRGIASPFSPLIDQTRAEARFGTQYHNIISQYAWATTDQERDRITRRARELLDEMAQFRTQGGATGEFFHQIDKALAGALDTFIQIGNVLMRRTYVWNPPPKTIQPKQDPQNPPQYPQIPPQDFQPQQRFRPRIIPKQDFRNLPHSNWQDLKYVPQKRKRGSSGIPDSLFLGDTEKFRMQDIISRANRLVTGSKRIKDLAGSVTYQYSQLLNSMADLNKAQIERIQSQMASQFNFEASKLLQYLRDRNSMQIQSITDWTLLYALRKRMVPGAIEEGFKRFSRLPDLPSLYRWQSLLSSDYVPLGHIVPVGYSYLGRAPNFVLTHQVEPRNLIDFLALIFTLLLQKLRKDPKNKKLKQRVAKIKDLLEKQTPPSLHSFLNLLK